LEIQENCVTYRIGFVKVHILNSICFSHYYIVHLNLFL
jgi:hypothetical protein